VGFCRNSSYFRQSPTGPPLTTTSRATCRIISNIGGTVNELAAQVKVIFYYEIFEFPGSLSWPNIHPAGIVSGLNNFVLLSML
jgi:hypothetical protein